MTLCIEAVKEIISSFLNGSGDDKKILVEWFLNSVMEEGNEGSGWRTGSEE
jgi:hypothetical protein